MRDRAAPFANTASWAHAAITLAVLWFGFNILFSGVFTIWTQSQAVIANPQVVDAFLDGSTPAAVGWSLATFGIYVVLLALSMQTLHRLKLRTLLGPIAPAFRQFARINLYLLPLYGLLILPSVFAPEAVQQFSIGSWLALLPALLPLLFVQIGAEELVFRGYLQSHLAALSERPLVWMLIPSLLFGLIHYDPLSPSYTAWAYVAWATCLGLVCADLTARSGTLGPALAVHFINNFGAMFILAADAWLYGAALFIWPTYGAAWEPWVPFEALFLLCVWLTARLTLRR